MSFANKQTLLLRLYQVLFDHSDENHPLTQQDIIEILDREYGLTVERKAIGRNVSYLNEMGIEVASSRKGTYLVDRPLENSELHMLIDSVLCSTHINATHSKQLIDKLVKMGGRNFKSHVKYVHSLNDWNKTQNKAVFLNVSVVDEAISNGKQVRFFYNKLGADMHLHHTSRPCVSPYIMLLHNQHYYLMGLNHKWGNMGFWRLDKITDIEVLDECATPIKNVEGYKNGINYKELSTARPYMFNDDLVRIVVKTKVDILDDLVDWFGSDISITQDEEQNIYATVYASPSAMKYWAFQYGENAEIIEPQALRNDIRNALKLICKTYEN